MKKTIAQIELDNSLASVKKAEAQSMLDKKIVKIASTKGLSAKQKAEQIENLKGKESENALFKDKNFPKQFKRYFSKERLKERVTEGIEYEKEKDRKAAEEAGDLVHIYETFVELDGCTLNKPTWGGILILKRVFNKNEAIAYTYMHLYPENTGIIAYVLTNQEELQNTSVEEIKKKALEWWNEFSVGEKTIVFELVDFAMKQTYDVGKKKLSLHTIRSTK